MQQQSPTLQRILAGTLLVLALVIGAISSVGTANGQNTTRFGERAETLPGIEQAVSRVYSSDTGYLLAYVFSFDTDANAQSALETLDAEYEGQFTDDTVPVDPLGTETRAYTHDATWSEVLTHEGRYVYVVSVVSYNAEVDLVGLATNLIRTMIAAEAGVGLGEYHPDGTSIGGLWDKLPPGGGEVPSGFRASQDEQPYPQRGNSENGEFDFGALPGIQRSVTRTYIGDTTALATPATAPATTYLLNALVAEFDTADHAAAALDSFHADAQASYLEEVDATLEPVDPGDLGDLAVADISTMEEDGLTYELALVIVQADTYVYVVVGVGVGADTGALETATAVIEAMLGAEAGSGDGTFDETGHSTGGLWDKLPAGGDDVLTGLVPEEDDQVYP